MACGLFENYLFRVLSCVLDRDQHTPQISYNKVDGFVKSPSAALRVIPALLNSRYARRRSRFNRVNHCDVRLSTPHSSIFARLASGAFYCAVCLSTFYETVKFLLHDNTKITSVSTRKQPLKGLFSLDLDLWVSYRTYQRERIVD